jgi:hypothetical protein
MDGQSCLLEAISSVPVPGAPPRLSKEAAAVGLSFLDSALRLNHVRRLTDRLKVVDHGAAHRTTEVDISLSLLDQTQRESSKSFQQLRSPNGRAEATGEIWVPVARISRLSVAPIDVRDASGLKLPRLTQLETSQLLASAMYRLLRGIMLSHPDAHRESPLYRLLHRTNEARWLIQSAIMTLMTDSTSPLRPHRQSRTSGTYPGYGEQCRTLALDVLRGYTDHLADFFQLFDIAVNDYLLVVAMDDGVDEHLLSYDAPLQLDHQPSARIRLPKMFRTNHTGYYIEYRNQLPPNLKSYHLVIEPDSNVEIDSMCLTSNSDRMLANGIVTDLEILADRLERGARAGGEDAHDKLLELETQTVLRRLAELIRARRWEASRAKIELSESIIPASSKLAWAAISGEATLNESGKPDSSLLQHPAVRPQLLRTASAEILEHELYLDLSVENDPFSGRAHAYWRRPTPRTNSSTQIDVRASMILRDTTGEGPFAVALYAVWVAVVAYSIGVFLTRDWRLLPGAINQADTVSNADAIVAVLLLVQGFLYTRLSLPSKRSIAGRLRALPRLVARICVGATALLSAAIASGLSGLPLTICFLVATAVPLAGSVLLQIRRTHTTPQVDLTRLSAPAWLMSSTMAGRRRKRDPDARFISTGSSYWSWQ